VPAFASAFSLVKGCFGRAWVGETTPGFIHRASNYDLQFYLGRLLRARRTTDLEFSRYRMNSFQEHNELLELLKFEEMAKKYGL